MYRAGCTPEQYRALVHQEEHPPTPAIRHPLQQCPSDTAPAGTVSTGTLAAAAVTSLVAGFHAAGAAAGDGRGSRRRCLARA